MTKKVLVGCSGSVATIKLPVLLSALQQAGCEVQVVVTNNARHFLKHEALPEGICIWKDEDEWEAWTDRGDPVLHIELGKWADVFVIAPLDANTLSKLSTGLCDNLLTCVARAWDLRKPLLFCPAMNTRMYSHPLTEEQIIKLKSFGYIEVPVVSKTLICGDSGLGAMAEVPSIVKTVVEHLSQNI